MLEKQSIEKYKGKRSRLVKSDGFVISGEIRNVFDDSIEFFTDGKLIILSFNRIGEISPLKHVHNGGEDYS